MPTLLPSNSTATERAIEGATARIEAVPVPIATLWNPQTCPAAFLPWLAHALSVDDWDAAWSEATKRAVIAASVEIHRHKGTLWAVKRALQLAGYGDATVIEAKDLTRLGPIAPAGRGRPLGRTWRLGWRDTVWADYWVEINQPIARRAADLLASRLQSVAPIRCRLRRITLSDGAQFVLGRDVWTLGDQTPLGGVFGYEVIENG